jgi:predicted RNA binding protein YcfA (HicA-like mRNA interferase family)
MDLKDIEQAARQQGWRVDRTKKGHPRFTPPDPTKQIVIGSGTPSDHRSLQNMLSQLRRQGFIWPWPPPQPKKEV